MYQLSLVCVTLPKVYVNVVASWIHSKMNTPLVYFSLLESPQPLCCGYIDLQLGFKQ